MSYENIYHYVLNKELSELPYITDQGTWDVATQLWELNHILGLLNSKEVARILKISSLCEKSARDALFTTLRERGIAGFRYLNSYEFPGTSVAILDPTVLELPEDGFEKLYGDSFESDFDEALDGISEDEMTVSRYCSSAMNNGTVGHWPIYIAEFDDLVSDIKKSFVEDDFGDPDDNEQIARTVSEYNNIIESQARMGITAITEWRRSYPKVTPATKVHSHSNP